MPRAFRQHSRLEDFARVPILPGLGPHQALGAQDFAMDTAHADVLLARAAPEEAVGATDAQVDFADDERAAGRVVPALEQLGLRVGIEDQGARRIERPRHHDFAIRRSGNRHVCQVVFMGSPRSCVVRFSVACECGRLPGEVFSSCSTASSFRKLLSQSRR